MRGKRQIVNRQQRKLYAMYAIGNAISIVKKYQININLKVESVYKIPKALEIDLFSFILIREMCIVYYEENDGEYPIFRNEYWRVIMNYH